MRKMLAVCAALLLAACVTTPDHADLARPQPLFSPAAFFSGRTHEQATLRVLLSGTTPVDVIGEGRVKPDGTLVLV